MTEGYVYRWTDSSNGKKYIGSHNGKDNNYKGSGKRFKLAYNKRPECFTREILYTGPDYIELEGFILEIEDVKNNDSYYNLSNQSGSGPILFGEDNPYYGKKHSPEIIDKIKKKRSKQVISKKPIIELSTGLRFEGVGECAEYHGIKSPFLSTLLKKNRPVLRGPNKGKHFIYEE